MVRVELPAHLRTLARVSGEVQLDVPAPVTIRAIIDALEARYPPLQGTLRDHGSPRRRPLVRFFACEDDLSNMPLETKVPEAIASGEEPLLIVGAIAGG